MEITTHIGMVQICKKLLACIGLNPERLRIEQVSAGEGIRFAEFMNDFSRRIRDLGPLGKGEGIECRWIEVKNQSAYAIDPLHQAGGKREAEGSL